MPPATKNTQHLALPFVLLTGIFLLSRTIFYYTGVRFDFTPLTTYWQYPEIGVLQHDLVHGLWNQPAQAPLFNFVLGFLLKISPVYPSVVFPLVFMLISWINSLILYKIVEMITGNLKLAIITSSIYLLAPATVLLENELFYTGFLSMLFLASAYFLVRWSEERKPQYGLLFFLTLAAICLTKSFYHIGWMGLLSLLLLIKFFPALPARKVVFAASFPLLLVAAWYLKNLVLFGTFSATSWTGMNLARLVFHNRTITDSTSIASIPPFYPVTYYSRFISHSNGAADTTHDKEFKQGRDVNMFNAKYLEVSKLYMEADRQEIAARPGAYLRNVATAGLIYFTPASSYFKVQVNEQKIRAYDAATSLNASSFFTGKNDQKTWLAFSSIPMLLLFVITIAFFIARPGRLTPLNYFLILTIIYSLLVSSFFEYGDNMRFRYEIQPLFLVLFAQYVQAFTSRQKRSA